MNGPYYIAADTSTMIHFNQPAIQAYVETFKLISNKCKWWTRYVEYREEHSDPIYDRMDKASAILHATFQTLAEFKQLRVKRFAGFTGLGYEQKWYHEIQILDQDKQVVETLIGSIDENDVRSMNADEQYIKSELRSAMYWRHNQIIHDPDIAQFTLVLPITFPNYPEFRDENGNPLDCGYDLHRRCYYPIVIVMDTQFIIDVFITKEKHEEKIREHTIKQCKKIKEELMINRWSPKRMEQLLEAGYDVEDM